MLNKKPIDISELKRTAEELLRDYSAYTHITTEESSRGTLYIIKAKEAVLKICIGNQWIGYELEVDKTLLGKEIGTFEDTDNYPFDDENAAMYKEIFEASLNCAKALFEKRIYVGIVDGKPVLVVPEDKKHFTLIKRRGFFSGSKETITMHQFKKLQNLRPLEI
jgi:hypothetical protein